MGVLNGRKGGTDMGLRLEEGEGVWSKTISDYGGLWVAVVGGFAFWRKEKGIGQKQSLMVCGYGGF